MILNFFVSGVSLGITRSNRKEWGSEIKYLPFNHTGYNQDMFFWLCFFQHDKRLITEDLCEGHHLA